MAEFDFPEFVAPIWLRTGHVQTIAGYLWPYKRPRYQARQRHIRLADGDRLVLHDDCPGAGPCEVETARAIRPLESLERRLTLATATIGDDSADERDHWSERATPAERSSPNDHATGWRTGDPVALMLHGLGGSHASGYMERASELLQRMGLRVFRLDQRGCGAGEELARYPGHAGRSEDAAAAVRCVRKLCPGSSIVVIAYSLGANIVLKMAGEMGEDAIGTLDSVVAIAPPFDLSECCKTLAQGMGRIYDRNFLRTLDRQFQRRKGLPGHFPPPRPRPKNLIEFDDRYTAPLSGFANVAEYYDRASARHWIGSIRIPTWVVAADDDPMIPRRLFDRQHWPTNVRVTITRGGGHLGHVARLGVDPSRRWLDWRVAQWVAWRFGLPLPRSC